MSRRGKKGANMLSKQQRYSIASLLAVNTTETVLKKIEPFDQEAIDFVNRIAKYYKKRDGFVPRPVINIINERG